jgi:hypothetical protein
VFLIGNRPRKRPLGKTEKEMGGLKLRLILKRNKLLG